MIQSLAKKKRGAAASLTMMSLLATVAAHAAPTSVTAPLECSRGPETQALHAVVTMPAHRPPGSTLRIRIDGWPSGKISHGGLNYIHDMTTDYLLPAGTRYLEGSARVLPATGTANAREGARVWRDGGRIRLRLPAKIKNGSSFTPPSLEFAVEIQAPAGTLLSLQFDHYEVTANVFLLGDLQTICEPRPKPYTIGVTRVDPKQSP